MIRPSSSKDLFAGVFSRHADAYNARHAAIRRSGGSRGRRLLLERLELRGDELVLDLCCGPGNLAADLLARWPQVRLLGADLAPGMLSVAVAELPGSAFALADAERLPFRTAAFGAVACGHGLQFCPNLGDVLAEVRRVLTTGGRFAASVPLPGRSPDPGQALLDRLLPPFPATPDREDTLRVVGDPDRLVAAAFAAGFAAPRVEEVTGEVSWSSPREMFEQAMGWWSFAARLEDTDAGRREAILEEVVAEFQADHGDGPIRIPSSDLVLYASA